MTKKSILFVCSGNIFRSISAEYALKQYLAENKIKGWKISSAGTIAQKQNMDPKTASVLKKLGIKNPGHTPVKLTEKILDGYDIIVAMGENHRKFISSKFKNKNVLLFNELAVNKKTSVLDIEEEIKDYMTNRKAVERKIEKTVTYIFNKMPELFRHASERFYLFSDFVDGAKNHNNGFPFISLYETPGTVAFMSIDIPKKEDGHILVIPKKRYSNLSDVPTPLLNELIGTIKKIATAISKNHGGYNILLNNGTEAGQYIFHTHFHLVPRNYDDGIKIETWNLTDISRRDFVNLNKKIRKQINSI